MPELLRIVGRAALTFMMSTSLRDVLLLVGDLFERVAVGEPGPPRDRPRHDERLADDTIFRNSAVHPRVTGVGPVVAHDEQLTFGDFFLELRRRWIVAGH